MSKETPPRTIENLEHAPKHGWGYRSQWCRRHGPPLSRHTLIVMNSPSVFPCSSSSSGTMGGISNGALCCRAALLSCLCFCLELIRFRPAPTAVVVVVERRVLVTRGRIQSAVPHYDNTEVAESGVKHLTAEMVTRCRGNGSGTGHVVP